MPELQPRYLVREDRAIRDLPNDDFERFPCWTVTRMTAGMGWHIGKYADEATAMAVAAMLQGVADAGKEVLS